MSDQENGPQDGDATQEVQVPPVEDSEELKGAGAAEQGQDIEDLIEPADDPDPEPELRPDEDDEPTQVTAAPLVQPADDAERPASYDSLEGEPLPPAQRAELSAQEAEDEQRDSPPRRTVFAIASAKGGVGKSLLAAGVGIFLAQLGKRVVLVDADLGGGNLHTLLGMERPRGSLHAFLRKEVQQIVEVVTETPISGLSLVPAHENAVGAANPRPAQKSRLLNQLRSLPVDYVVIDLSPGAGFNALDIFLSADLHVVITCPEPTAIESAFRLIKSAFVRKVRHHEGLRQILDDLAPRAYCGIPTPHQIYTLARERDPALGGILHEAMAEFRPRLVLNKARTRDDLELGQALTTVGRRHLSLPLDYLGHMENDDMAWVTVRRRRPLLVEYPDAKVSRDIQRIARRLVSLETKERSECLSVPKPMQDQNHYEVLGLHPGASNEDVRRAQRRVRRFYGKDSSAIYGIAPPVEVDQMHRRIDEAYSTLVDPEKRHLYNQNLFPGGQLEEQDLAADPRPRRESVVEQEVAPAMEDLPDMPQLDPDTEFSGPLLRQVRQAMGIELSDIADKTKITMTYLRAMEDEDYTATPAPVYLRGFVKTVARELKLDSEHVAATYMARHDAITGED